MAESRENLSGSSIGGAGTRIARRRTFAIISHPDAGKTTLTEHLLLFGGAIHLAGEVKSRGEARRARSDWMKIEQERGISVTSAVMTFEYEDVTFNLLDTPGHEDFSEDTYRTLTAADSAIMVIDAAKGIEAQTLKLFEVCRLRDIPIITFVNKIDREGLDPFELLDEISDKLALDTTPITWPLGMGGRLAGIADLQQRLITPYAPPGKKQTFDTVPLTDASLAELVGDPEKQAAMEESFGLANEGYPAWDEKAYREGHLTPVFFGSALRNFGVRDVLRAVARWAPPPGPRAAKSRVVEPTEAKLTGFVFKVQANMNSKHRDSVAFVRLCSGKFTRGMKVRQSSTGKMITVSSPILFFAQDREIVEEAWPGDIIGLPNHGTIRVGEALSEGEEIVFAGIPDFAPEILRRVRLADPMRAKHLHRALESLADEGVSQVFKSVIGATWIVGVVGQLQLEVLARRLGDEYNVEVAYETIPYSAARWVDSDDPVELKRFVAKHQGHMVTDRDNLPVLLASSEWEINYLSEQWPKITFSSTRERTV